MLSYGGGAAAGALVGLVSCRCAAGIDDPLLGNVAMLLTPFTAFLLAELIHASGVLAVVVCRAAHEPGGPRMTRAATRQQTEAFWSLATFLLNGSLFVLVGLQAQSAVREPDQRPRSRAWSSPSWRSPRW